MSDTKVKVIADVHESEAECISMSNDGISEELVRQLYRSRASYAAHVTRRHNEFNQAVRDNKSILAIQTIIENVETAFHAFSVAHKKYVACATEVEPHKVEICEKHISEMIYMVQMARCQFDDMKVDEIVGRNSKGTDVQQARRPLHGEKDGTRITDKFQDSILPVDSISQVGSRSSSVSSRAKAAAKKAALQAKLTFLKDQEALQHRQVELDWQMKQVEIESELCAVAAEEEVLAKYSSCGSLLKEDNNSACGTGGLNPNANPWTPHVEQRSLRNDGAAAWLAQLTTSTQMLEALNLPKTTIMKFDGDPLDFYIFMNTFDNIVDSASVSDAAKLARLFEYCEDKAKSVIKPCALMSPREGYARARQLLKDRFGNEYVVAEAWVDKVISGDLIKANCGNSIQQLADDVRGCYETLKAMGRLEDVDSRVRMVKIVERLPPYMQSRWRTYAVDMLDRSHKYPGIAELSTFLDRLAREQNDPVFGLQGKGQRTDQLQSRQRKSSASFIIKTSDDHNVARYSSDAGITNESDISPSSTTKFREKFHKYIQCFLCQRNIMCAS